MKKRIIAILLACTMAFSLTACGDSGDIVGLPEGMEDMSEEELAALVDAYENGELNEEAVT
ncbi:MAG: nitrile hydratase subunit alpha [Lachnospiraceae bacterium]|nr:nitrile hydratase subunit alpha [Lachnospiraceae bacterium]